MGSGGKGDNCVKSISVKPIGGERGERKDTCEVDRCEADRWGAGAKGRLGVKLVVKSMGVKSIGMASLTSRRHCPPLFRGRLYNRKAININ